MGVHVTIRNDEPEDSQAVLAGRGVTVGDLDAREAKHLVQPQQSVSVEVDDGQFLMVDDTTKD